jgi:hypothetical protein
MKDRHFVVPCNGLYHLSRLLCPFAKEGSKGDPNMTHTKPVSSLSVGLAGIGGARIPQVSMKAAF